MRSIEHRIARLEEHQLDRDREMSRIRDDEQFSYDEVYRRAPHLLEGLRQAALAHGRGDPNWEELHKDADRAIDDWMRSHGFGHLL